MAGCTGKEVDHLFGRIDTVDPATDIALPWLWVLREDCVGLGVVLTCSTGLGLAAMPPEGVKMELISRGCTALLRFADVVGLEGSVMMSKYMNVRELGIT